MQRHLVVIDEISLHFKEDDNLFELYGDDRTCKQLTRELTYIAYHKGLLMCHICHFCFSIIK